MLKFVMFDVYEPFREVLKGPALPWILVGGVGAHIVLFLLTWIFSPDNPEQIHDRRWPSLKTTTNGKQN